MPGIAAGILISTYLPGLVIASIWYLEEVICRVDCGTVEVFMEQVNAVSTLSNLYFLGAFALAAGLVIDAFKHFIEWLLTCTRWKRLVWGELKKEELKAIEKNLCPTTVNHVLQRYSLLYHTYEFFSNLTVAMIIAAAWWLLFWGEHYRPFFFSYGTVKGAGILAVIGIVSGGLGFLYKSKANELIGRFNRGR